MYTENAYIMWLNSLIDISAANRRRLLEHFGGAKAVWDASSADVSRVAGINSDTMYKIMRTKTGDTIEKLLKGCEKAGARFVTYKDEEYPDILREIYDWPIGYYIIGEMPDTLYNTAIVGSRTCTEYGRETAYQISKQLAQNGVNIISGMAEGIDGCAHRGALDGGGKTVAVMGTGIDICYPSVHTALRNDIIKNGCIISEFPTGMHGTAFTFPARNRIISGLSRSVAVIEAAERSGSLITANVALDQGREVFAVPGNINSKFSKGTNGLIKQGASVLTSADDILSVYGIDKKKKTKREKNTNNFTEPNEKSVYDAIDIVPQSVEELAAKTGLDTSTLQSTLMMLEINGHIKKMSGQRYVRNQ
ncbi:MAG: DNA-processing protein DprA [Firmicutes bacterium]|nr:DNA-processing protein DprA [Bacillota bacterium]